MSDLNNFTVQYSIVKDVAKLYYTITEDNYSASGDYTYQECMDVWKEHCLDYGLSGVNSTTQSYDKTSEAKRLVALCVPIGAFIQYSMIKKKVLLLILPYYSPMLRN